MEGEGNRTAEITGTINLTPNNEIPNLTGQVHRLPCCIKHTGPCAVSNYFKPKPTGLEVEGLKVEEAHFRGRKLQGASLPLPPCYTGVVLGKKSVHKRKANDVSGENSNYWETKAKFENITYWNHDSIPSRNDAFVHSLHWLSVAEALHKPITAEDLASTSTILEKSSNN